MSGHFSSVADGPGKWLLDPRIQANFETNPLSVGFKVEYDDGRWTARTAKTVNSMFITERVLPHEVVLASTDQRGKPVIKHVAVQFLLPSKPHLHHGAVVIDGPDTGEVGMVKSKSQKTKLFTIHLRNSSARPRLPEEALCRLAKK